MKKMKLNVDWGNVVVFIIMILAIAAGSCLISWLLQDTERSRNVEARCKTIGGETGYLKCYKNGKEI